MKQSKASSIHQNHRNRLRERCNSFGVESLADHEYLELLLYYSIPRTDTNPIAHALIEHFGSLQNVFEASRDELMQVEGVGEGSALLLSSLIEGYRRYARDSRVHAEVYDTVSKIADYIWCRFLGRDHERLYLMLFNNKMNMIDCCVLSDGSVNSANAPVRLMVEKAIQKKAAAAVLAHNHPHGNVTPSNEDIEVTCKLAEALMFFEIPLCEHLIVTDDRFSAIMKHHYHVNRMVNNEKKVLLVGGNAFSREAFYDVDDETYRFPALFPEQS
ncbi:MAG: RadC family protein [Clostridia bacterium]|nr:RadC family protein [Clostridia bacterium]